MSSNFKRREITDAFLALLIAHLTEPVTTVVPPENVLGQAGRILVPYCVIYPIPGSTSHASLDDPHDQIVLEYQVTSAGLRREQAEWLADQVRTIVVGRDANGSLLYPIVPVSGYVVDRSVAMFGGTVSEAPGAYTVVESYNLVVT